MSHNIHLRRTEGDVPYMWFTSCWEGCFHIEPTHITHHQPMSHTHVTGLSDRRRCFFIYYVSYMFHWSCCQLFQLPRRRAFQAFFTRHVVAAAGEKAAKVTLLGQPYYLRCVITLFTPLSPYAISPAAGYHASWRGCARRQRSQRHTPAVARCAWQAAGLRRHLTPCHAHSHAGRANGCQPNTYMPAAANFRLLPPAAAAALFMYAMLRILTIMSSELGSLFGKSLPTQSML